MPVSSAITEGFSKVEDPHVAHAVEDFAPGINSSNIQQFFQADTHPLFVTISLSMIGSPNSLDVRAHGYIGNHHVGGAHIRRDGSNMVVCESSFSMYIPLGHIGYYTGELAGGSSPSAFHVSVTSIKVQ